MPTQEREPHVPTWFAQTLYSPQPPSTVATELAVSLSSAAPAEVDHANVFTQIHQQGQSSRSHRRGREDSEQSARVYTNTCAVWLNAFDQGEIILRASCNHVFHALCFSELVQHSLYLSKRKHNVPTAVSQQLC